MTDMTADWLDEERRGRIVYGKAIHHACRCKWDTDTLTDEKPEEAMYVLRERDRTCPIHGAKGHV